MHPSCSNLDTASVGGAANITLSPSHTRARTHVHTHAHACTGAGSERDRSPAAPPGCLHYGRSHRRGRAATAKRSDSRALGKPSPLMVITQIRVLLRNPEHPSPLNVCRVDGYVLTLKRSRICSADASACCGPWRREAPVRGAWPSAHPAVLHVGLRCHIPGACV